MSSRPELETFLQKWRAALREQAPNRLFWEGQRAYLDLKQTDYLDRVRLEEGDRSDASSGSGINHFIPEHALPKICKVIGVYRKNISNVRELVEPRKIQEEWLTQKERAFEKKAATLVRDPEYASDLRCIAKKIAAVKRGRRLSLSHELHEELRIAHPFKGYGKIRQERQLDSWFQVQLGSVMRDFMRKEPPTAQDKDHRGPSLRTIARLIVLFLVGADLADVQQGFVRLKHNQHAINVDSVLQHLRRAGL